MPLRQPSTAMLLAVCFLSTGCNLFGGDCVSIGHPAIELTIVDDDTNRIPTVPSVITVTDGPFVAVFPLEGQPAVILPYYSFAFERSGNYSVRVETPGYATWVRRNVKSSSRDRCGSIKPVKLKAELRRQ